MKSSTARPNASFSAFVNSGSAGNGGTPVCHSTLSSLSGLSECSLIALCLPVWFVPGCLQNFPMLADTSQRCNLFSLPNVAMFISMKQHSLIKTGFTFLARRRCDQMITIFIYPEQLANIIISHNS